MRAARGRKLKLTRIYIYNVGSGQTLRVHMQKTNFNKTRLYFTSSLSSKFHGRRCPLLLHICVDSLLTAAVTWNAAGPTGLLSQGRTNLRDTRITSGLDWVSARELPVFSLVYLLSTGTCFIGRVSESESHSVLPAVNLICLEKVQ